MVKDITFETRSGELIQLLLKDPTSYTKNLNLELTKNKGSAVWADTMKAVSTVS